MLWTKELKEEAVSRHIGLISREEQETLRVLKHKGLRAVSRNCYFDPYARRYYKGWAPFGRVRLRDRLMKWMAYRRYPSLKRLHDEEMAVRAQTRWTPAARAV